MNIGLNGGWLGTPYDEFAGDKTVKGKKGKGDCSGTTWGIYKEAGFYYKYLRSSDFVGIKHDRFIELNLNPASLFDI